MLTNKWKKMDFKNLSFDEAMNQLEAKIAELEKPENNNNQKLFSEAMALKDYCAELLKKEKEDIIKIARDNNIPLEEIGLDENGEYLNDEDDEDDEDDDDNNTDNSKSSGSLDTLSGIR